MKTNNVIPMKESGIARPPESQNIRMGIVGLGFVGKAVEYAFSTKYVEKFIVDPKFNNNTLQDLLDFQPVVTWVCLPTPSKEDGSIDASVVETTVKNLISGSQSFIVIKSTCTPDVIEKLTRLDRRVVYEPEFLTEANAIMDYLSPRFRIVGCVEQSAFNYIQGLYNMFSLCDSTRMSQMTPVEAAFFKYAINTFLAMKITFMNQLKTVVDSYGGSYNQLSKALPMDPRIGHTHMKIPGTDGKEGFGGACFPKDLNAFIQFAEDHANVDPALLKSVRDINNNIRSQYELGDREKEQNVNYGQAKEELKDKDNGSPKSK